MIVTQENKMTVEELQSKLKKVKMIQSFGALISGIILGIYLSKKLSVTVNTKNELVKTYFTKIFPFVLGYAIGASIIWIPLKIYVISIEKQIAAGSSQSTTNTVK